VIVVDTSALMAVLLDEPTRPAVAEALFAARSVSISAGTLIECAVVSRRRGVAARMHDLLVEVAPATLPIDAEAVGRIRAADARWGVGPARLNFGDLFAYDAAISRNAPLLFVGDDFAATDVRSALEETP